MQLYMKSAAIDIQEGLLRARISFQPGLNLISGENGTFKTKLLQTLRNTAPEWSIPGPGGRRQAISPKRNAQRRGFTAIWNELRRENKKLEGMINERDINDGTFEAYPSIGDLYYAVYDDLCKDGGSQTEKMNEATSTFNRVIQQIFPNYELRARWLSGAPSIDILKNGKTTVPIEGLSLGEQEILSLTTNIFSSRDRYEVFLIDEPEVHLNWHLEERLFEFLDKICVDYKRQMIVVTHSRVVFKERFYKKTQFLFWNDTGTVSIGKDVTSEQRRRIAGDAIEIIRLGTFTKPTIFVEDRNQVIVVEEMAASMGSDVLVSDCGNKFNLRSLFKYAQLDGGWENTFFVEDGDNEGSSLPQVEGFIHLDKYCIENYLLDIQTMAKTLAISEEAALKLIYDSIMSKSDKIIKQQDKFWNFLIEYLKPERLTSEKLAMLDASLIFNQLLKSIGKDLREYTSAYIRVARELGWEKVFPVPLIRALETGSNKHGIASL